MNYDSVKYFISINQMQLREKLPTGDPRWYKFTHGFTNCELTQYDIAERICSGHAYCSWLAGGRAKEHFQLAQHIAIDFDTEDERSSIDRLLSMPFVQMYGGIIHTTPSHTPQAPRARILFFLDRPVLEIAQYESMVGFLINLFGSDQSCKDATRFFYGTMDGEIAPLFRELPISHLRAMYKRYIARFPQQRASTPEAPASNVLRLSDYRRQADSPSGEGDAKSLIDWYNSQNRIEQVLAKYGYTKCNNRIWSRPGKKESAGVFIDHGKNKTYNHSSNDALFAGRNGANQPADPFDYYCNYEHDGDVRAALSAIERSQAA